MPGSEDIDAAFADIVSRWDDTPPATEEPDIASEAATAAESPIPVEPTWVDRHLAEDHFEPDPVVLPPQEDLHFWGIVAGLTVGPLLLLWYVTFGTGHSRWWLYAALGLCVAGFGLLVLRQPAHRGPDDDDDGARV